MYSNRSAQVGRLSWEEEEGLEEATCVCERVFLLVREGVMVKNKGKGTGQSTEKGGKDERD
jgi:hypothetical protein